MVYIEKVIPHSFLMHTFWNCFWDPLRQFFQHPCLKVKMVWIKLLPFLSEAVKTPEGHTYYYNSRQPSSFFWGAWNKFSWQACWVWIVESEVCCSWCLDRLSDPGSLEMSWGSEISWGSMTSEHFLEFPGPTTKIQKKIIETFIQHHFPRNSPNNSDFLGFCPFFFRFQPHPSRTWPRLGPGNRPGNVLWRSEDLWLLGWTLVGYPPVRSTMFSVGTSTISTGPFSICNKLRDGSGE